MPSNADLHSEALDRILTLELARVTERAAVGAARLRGRGDEKAADQAAVDAMRRELNRLPIDGDDRPSARASATRRRCSSSARRSARGEGPEGPYRSSIRLRARRSAPRTCLNSIAVMAMAPKPASLLNAPDSLHGQDRDRARAMPAGVVDLDALGRPTTSMRWPRPRAFKPSRDLDACVHGPPAPCQA